MIPRSLKTTASLATLIGIAMGCASTTDSPARTTNSDGGTSSDGNNDGSSGASDSKGGASVGTGGENGDGTGTPVVHEGDFDIVVYGATSGGVIAAIQAKRMGKTVALIEPSQHIGGLTSGGLGATDWGDASTISGLSYEFYVEVHNYYKDASAWDQEASLSAYLGRISRSPLSGQALMQFEPHVAEVVYESMLKKEGITPENESSPLVIGQRLDLDGGVTKEGNTIVSIRMESGLEYSGKMFIDTSYEGDLMAEAGVSYVVGREGREKYGEKHAGYLPGWELGQAHLFKPQITFSEPFPPGFDEKPDLEPGEGDHRVQAYNFRMCLTDQSENRVPWTAPEGYDAGYFLALGRYLIENCYFKDGDCHGPASLETEDFIHVPMPNHKTDTNNRGPFSTDFVGGNYEYPDADYATRERIIKEHEKYQKGLMYYLSTVTFDDLGMDDGDVSQTRCGKNESVSQCKLKFRGYLEAIRQATNKWGLAKDEFVDNNNWPHQLYVREARRMVSDVVMTEHHGTHDEIVEDSVGLGSYHMDSHHVQRYLANGTTVAEGNFITGVAGPYPISYRSIRPKADEATNLFVTFALSASHCGFGSIRMEPVFMMTSQSAATAAAIAIDDSVIVQEVSYAKLKEQLEADGLKL